jgi:sulfur carrier protein
MQVQVNGTSCETQAEFVAGLVREQGVDAARIAVVLNDEVVPAAARASTRLHPGDRIELLRFAAGG